jgi:hypothetical protein
VGLRPPDLQVPFPLEINPSARHAEQHGRDFVRRFGLVPGEASRRHHDESLLGTLIARTYPTAARADIELITDWMSCMLVVDDQFDETELGIQPDRLRQVADQILEWLPVTGGPPAGGGRESPFAAAFTDLWQRTCVHMSVEWRRRFVGHVDRFFDCCRWEAHNRLHRLVPGLAEYRSMRGRALMPYLDFIELTTRAEIPDPIYHRPELTELYQSLSDAVLWTNDLFSCEKEALLGDVHNLVLVYQHAHGTDLQTAADVAGEMIQDRIDTFVTLVREFREGRLLSHIDGDLRDTLDRHVTAMCSWLRGQLQWRYETHRFDPDRPEILTAADSSGALRTVDRSVLTA